MADLHTERLVLHPAGPAEARRIIDGTVEIGYGLAPSARGHGYAAEAVRVSADLAARFGVERVVADSDRARRFPRPTRVGPRPNPPAHL